MVSWDSRGAESIVNFWTSTGGTNAGGKSAGGTSEGGTSAGGTSADGVVGAAWRQLSDN